MNTVLVSRLLTLNKYVARFNSFMTVNQSNDLASKSMDWFLYDSDFRHERGFMFIISFPILMQQTFTNTN